MCSEPQFNVFSTTLSYTTRRFNKSWPGHIVAFVDDFEPGSWYGVASGCVIVFNQGEVKLVLNEASGTGHALEIWMVGSARVQCLGCQVPQG